MSTGTLPPLTPPGPEPAAARADRGGRLAGLRARRAETARWERPALAGLLLATLLLYVWDLSREGWANTYYAAAVQAGTHSWSAFFFGSLDSSNFITVDKPPFSLWAMELSARVFGLNSWSLLLPQAIAGVLTVLVTYLIVRRWFSAIAALVAGAVLALTPAAALMFRYDNPDAMLTLLLVLGAYALVRAIEAGRTAWLLAAGALIGLAFLTKSLQAFLVLPPFALVWLVAAPGAIGRRLWQMAAAAGTMLVAGGWWVAIVELMPASSRPYIGGSTDNSVLGLIFGYNGLDRLSGGGGPGGGGGGMGFSGSAGIGRLFNDQMGGQISWLLPFAAVGLVAGLWARRGTPRTDRMRAAYLLWGGWALTHALVFSYMTGIVHTYYTVAMAPAVGALVGMGGVELWRMRERPSTRWALSLAIAASGVWAYALLERTPDFAPGLSWLVLIASLAAAAVLLVDGARLPRRAGLAAVAVAAVALLAGPAAYAMDTAGSTHAGGNPSAGPTVVAAAGGPGGMAMGGGPQGAPPGGAVPNGVAPPGAAPGRRRGGAPPGRAARSRRRRRGRGASANATLVDFLRAHRGSARWIAATSGAGSAGPLQLAADAPVMSMGGFNGGDPSPTLAEFVALVKSGDLRFYVGGGMGGGGFGGREGDSAAIQSWVEEHGTQVDSAGVGGATVYDLASAAAS